TLTATPETPTVTPTLSPTPPKIGVVIHTGNVFVRAEPDYTADDVGLVAPGTELELHYSNDAGSWLFVRLLDEDGRLVEGWIDARLIDTQDFNPPTQGPTQTPSPIVTEGSI